MRAGNSGKTASTHFLDGNTKAYLPSFLYLLCPTSIQEGLRGLRKYILNVIFQKNKGSGDKGESTGDEVGVDNEAQGSGYLSLAQRRAEGVSGNISWADPQKCEC